MVRKGRLGPGEMLTVDTASGEVLAESDVAGRLAADKPYVRWLQENLVKLDDLMIPGASPGRPPDPYPRRGPVSSGLASPRLASAGSAQ